MNDVDVERIELDSRARTVLRSLPAPNMPAMTKVMSSHEEQLLVETVVNLMYWARHGKYPWEKG
jgi:hypothetical protein